MIRDWFAKKRDLQVIVTGLPRSGTSFLTGLISRMNLSLGLEGWQKPADEHNRFGYFECVPLMQVSYSILERLGGTFHQLPASIPTRYKDFVDEKKEIRRLVSKGKVDLYKDNRLTIIGDLYDEIYPNAKWIYIDRATEATYKSRFGDEIGREDWEILTQQRLEKWHQTRVSKKALNLHFETFRSDIDASIDQICHHLELSLSDKERAHCKAFFRPREKGARSSLNS